MLLAAAAAAAAASRMADWLSYTVFAFWCKRGLVCMCFEPFTPSRKYGVEYPERSEIRFRKSVDFRKTTDFYS